MLAGFSTQNIIGQGFNKIVIGLGNVDNTADVDKPVSTPQATAIADARTAASASITGLVDNASSSANTLGKIEGIIFNLLGGVPAAGNTLAKLYALMQNLDISGPILQAKNDLIGGAPVGRQTLKALNDAIVTAQTTANGAFQQGGGTLTGSVTVKLNAPQFRAKRADDNTSYGFYHYVNDGKFYIQKYNADDSWNADIAVFSASGLSLPSSIGDIKTYIDASSNNKVLKSGDQMSGSLTIAGGGLIVANPNPYIDLVYGNVLRARWTVDGSGNTILRNGDNGDNYFYVQTNGAMWTKQFGDVNTYWEGRCGAHQQAAVNRCVTGIRLVYVGDENIAAQFNGGMREAYGASYISGRATILSSDNVNIIVSVFRYRQVQYLLTNAGGWVASYFA
jgi:hypothetical protein